MANSPDQPRPADLADGNSGSLFATAVGLAIAAALIPLGIVLIVVSWRRQRREEFRLIEPARNASGVE